MVVSSQAHDFARRINAAWRKSVEGIFEAGRLLVGAKAALGHGAFTKIRNGIAVFTSDGRAIDGHRVRPTIIKSDTCVAFAAELGDPPRIDAVIGCRA